MPTIKFPVLTGGTFFVLLSNSKKPSIEKSKRMDGYHDAITEPYLISRLIRIVEEDHFDVGYTSSTAKSNTSQYKSCKIESSEWLNINDSGYVGLFDERIKNEFTQLLINTNLFIKDCLDSNSFKLARLGRMILELVSLDESITPDAKFYINLDGSYIEKRNINPGMQFSLQNLILGVWYYIVSNKIINSLGEDTFNEWHTPSDKNKERKFISDIGNGAFKETTIQVLPDTDAHLDPEVKEKEPFDASRLVNHYDFSAYLENAKNKYGEIKTVLYADDKHPFEEFYVCNDIRYTPSEKLYDPTVFSRRRYQYLKKATSSILRKTCGNFMVLTGTGGLGKTMMMTHLLLTAIESYKEDSVVPLLISLKDYNEDSGFLSDFVFSKLRDLCLISKEEYNKELLNGRFLFLFDGMDEIPNSIEERFTKQIESFTDRYSSNMFIITSRPYSDFVKLGRFTVLTLMPFEKEQAIQLIKNLEFRVDEPEFKEHFIKELDENLFTTHTDFTKNPLLLTLMLLTYDQFAEVPSKMHVFYKLAYETLSRNHDARKGGFHRVLSTGLSSERILEYIELFCSKAYLSERFEFTKDELQEYFNVIKPKAKKGIEDISFNDFLIDLQHNLCLMFIEDGKFKFIHRSFQEYFAALSFSHQKEESLVKIGNWFSSRKFRSSADRTFDMLYDMIPAKIEDCVFLPHMEEIISKFDKDEPYVSYINQIFYSLRYGVGDDIVSIDNKPCGFLYDFISNVAGFKTGRKLDISYEYYGYVDEEYRFVQIDDNNWDVVETSEIPEEQRDVCDVAETIYMIDLEDMTPGSSEYDDTVSMLSEDDCDFMIEYKGFMEYYNKLKKRKEDAKTDDLFDEFI